MKELIAVVISVVVFSLSLVFLCGRIRTNIASTVSMLADDNSDIIILDAGHGGEDGGCVAYDNTLEKNINLQIANITALYFDLFGINYVQIRTEDISVGDVSLPTIKARKVSDIKNRFEIVNSYNNSILVSIHQNMYTVEKYFGTQVFYSPNDEESKTVADFIQATIKSNLQQDNDRVIKASNDSIYLLYNAKRPSVMVECGFLSNMNELEKLKTVSYQNQIAYFIFKGLNNYYNSKE